MFIMLNTYTYNIGKKYNEIVKHNINYDRRCTLDFTCAMYIFKLLQSPYTLNSEQINKLLLLQNKLIAL